MGFILDYQPFFSLDVKAEGSGDLLPGLDIVPTSACNRRMHDHQLIFRPRQAGFAVYFASNPRAIDPLIGAITHRSRFGFALQLADTGFFSRYAPDPAAMPAPQLYFDNLTASGGIQPVGQQPLSEGAVVDQSDAARIHPHVFLAHSDLAGATPPTRYLINDKFDPAVTVKEVAIKAGGGIALASTRIDLADQSGGPYLITTDAAGALPQTIYLDEALAAQGCLGIVDIYWEARQDAVPAGGLHYTLTFKRQ